MLMFFIGPNQLTVSALEKHDEEYSHGVSKPDLDAATFKTWATHYTECTNTTFNKVHQNWNNDAMQKEVRNTVFVFCLSVCCKSISEVSVLSVMFYKS